MIAAQRVPEKIRKHILEEDFINKARNVDIVNTPMEYLFDVYEEFIDTAGEHDDWNCFKCREHILSQWKKLEPILKQLNDA